MNLKNIQVPERSSELVELETRFRKLQSQRAEAEAKLRRIETHIARQAMADDSEADRLAAQLASGEIDKILMENLPAAASELRAELDIITRSSAKLWPVLVRHRERHNNEIIRAFRPAHRAAAQRILQAVMELVEANKDEQMVRAACPVQLVSVQFPHVGDFTCNNAHIAKFWREHVARLGFLDDKPEPAPPPKAKRGLFGGRSNGAAAEAVPLAAKATE